MSLGERVRAAAEPHLGDAGVPGVVALIGRGDEVIVELFGNLDVGGAPVQRDSLFRIASTSKPITAAATLVVIEEGLIGLDEPVDRLLPELAGRRVLVRPDGPLSSETVPAERSITTRDLLTFTFGFGMVTEMFGPGAPWPVVAATRRLGLSTIGPPNPDVQPDPDTWIAGLGTLPLLAHPGDRWMYNTGASVLGVLLARATGLPFADVLRTRLFEPLGMRDTGFWTADIDRLATAYVAKPDGLAVWDPPDGQWSRAPAFGDGAAGLISTADDLLAFSRMLLTGGGSVLPAAAVRAMCSDQLSDGQKAFGGLGPGFFARKSWGYCQAVYDGGAFGWNGGLGTSWIADPARDLTVIVMTQRLFESAELPQAHRDIQAAALGG
ncbi:MAG TPA: serine hydrolase domain-containing protein [Solirubrobacteraceae bacterium]|nr:serine hydrolase domain-containing protein [Solirubrobacteraceae bacterium]